LNLHLSSCFVHELMMELSVATPLCFIILLRPGAEQKAKLLNYVSRHLGS